MEEITGATVRSSSMGPASLRDGPGAMDAVGFSGELQDDRTVHQPVQKCRCQRRVRPGNRPTLQNRYWSPRRSNAVPWRASSKR